MSARTSQDYGKTSLIYTCKSLQSLRKAFDFSQSLSVVFDEARMINCKVLQVFASSPLTDDIPQGMALAPQLKREMHVDLDKKKIAIRIEEAMTMRPSKTASKPTADPLVATYDLILALHNALKMVLPGAGVLCFKAKHAQPSLLVIGNGRYARVMDGSVGRWQVTFVDKEGVEHCCWLLPDPEDWASDPWPVLCMTADQDSENFAMYVHLAFHEMIMIVFSPTSTTSSTTLMTVCWKLRICPLWTIKVVTYASYILAPKKAKAIGTSRSRTLSR